MVKRSVDYGTEELYMARLGAAFNCKGADLATLNAGVVPVAAGNIKAIPEGEAAVVVGFMLYLSTASDWVRMVIGVTAEADGSGAFTELSPHLPVDTGASISGRPASFIKLPMPIYIKYSMGKAVAVKLTTNDVGATICFALAGWLEEYTV